MRKLNFEDDDSVTTSNTVTNIPVTKPLSHLFIKKDRKIQSDPFLECRPKKPFDFFDFDNDVPSQPAVRKYCHTYKKHIKRDIESLVIF